MNRPAASLWTLPRILAVLAVVLVAGCPATPSEPIKDLSFLADAVPGDTATADDAATGADWGVKQQTEVCGKIKDAPDAVLFRSNLRSFNSKHYAIVCGKQIHVRPNTERTGAKGPWQKLDKLPAALAGDVAGISMDDRFLMAANSGGRLWQMTNANKQVTAFKWNEYRGMPFGMGPHNYLPKGTLKWDQSVVSPEEDKNYTDPAGNKFEVGWATCAHFIVLRPGGRWIAFNDAWLPADLNYEVCGPRRGRFRAVNLSASGSTFMVINRYGDIYTRLWDWDISGPNTAFYKYSYYDQTGKANPARQLPAAPWKLQAKIKGRVTDRISLHKIGKDCLRRVMRVEGVDGSGKIGYYEKELMGAAWTFRSTGAAGVVGKPLDNKPVDTSGKDLAKAEDVRYTRNMAALASLSSTPKKGTGLGDDEWAAELLDFNCYCSPARLRVHLSKGSTLDLLLHTTETLRLDVRQGRGLDSKPRPRNGTIEVPAATLAARKTLAVKARRFIAGYLGGKQFTALEVKATSTSVVLKMGSTTNWTFSK